MILQKPENLSVEDQHTLDLLKQTHPQMKVACELAQTFALMVRQRNASALEPWLERTTESGIPELADLCHRHEARPSCRPGCLTYEWSQGQVEGQVNRLKLLKR